MRKALVSLAAATAFSAMPLRAADAPRDAHAFASFTFDPKVPLTDRVSPIPEWLLKEWSDADKAPEYAVYMPSKKERREFAEAVNGLPPRMRSAMEKRLIAFYFVENLKGNGITDWALDASSNVYVTMILNPAGLKKTLSQALTERERSAFAGSPDLTVDAGPDGSGILYTVAHECTHAFDYIEGLTPFVEPGLGKRQGRPDRAWDVWQSYRRPLKEDDYPARAKLGFYGLSGPPKLRADEAPEVCAELAASPFTSLYGSKSWAEDVAELFVARHLARDLRRPFKWVCGGKTREPLADPRVADRIERLLRPIDEKP